jgi:ABC-2 type transport system permease protein
MTTSLAFWFNRLLNIANVFAHSVDIARYPVTIFHPFIQFIFTYILPFALLGFLPAEVMLGRKSPWQLLLPIFLAAILLYLSHLFWSFSLRRYQSASS